MSSTNKRLRDGIRRVSEALSAFSHNKCTPNLDHYANELLDLLHNNPDDSPTDTERLDWLCEHSSLPGETSVKDIELSTPKAALPFCKGLYTTEWKSAVRAAIDAAMRPAPKYRKWTQAEAIGKVVRRKDNQAVVGVITFVSHGYAWIASEAWALERVLTDWEQLDGTPCGVLEVDR